MGVGGLVHQSLPCMCGMCIANTNALCVITLHSSGTSWRYAYHVVTADVMSVWVQVSGL
jgi:hypothetical protein